jgi:hypothetical protein
MFRSSSTAKPAQAYPGYLPAPTLPPAKPPHLQQHQQQQQQQQMQQQSIATMNTVTQSNTATTAKSEHTSTKTNGTVVTTTYTDGAAASKILGARDRVAAEVERMRQSHLVGLDWVVGELDGLRLTYETQMSQYQKEISNYKQEISTKTSQLTSVQTQLVRLGEEKNKAVADVTVSLELQS